MIAGRMGIAMFLAGLLAVLPAAAAKPDEERAEIRSRSAEVLASLYAAQPTARAAVRNASGYATFSNFGLKIGIVGGGRGKGLAVRNASGGQPAADFFMRYVEVNAGLGLGVRRTSLIFVFETPQAFNNFVEDGWQIGGEGTAAFTQAGKGKAMEGAFSLAEGVWLYQLTDTGIALEFSAKGTKYYQDKDLN